MHIELTPEMEILIAKELRSGNYSSAGNVVEEALRRTYREPGEVTEAKAMTSANWEELFRRFDEADLKDFEVERDLSPAIERDLF